MGQDCEVGFNRGSEMKWLFIIICLLYGGVVFGMCELLPPATAIPLVGVICFTQFVAVLWLLLFWKIPYEKIQSDNDRTETESEKLQNASLSSREHK